MCILQLLSWFVLAKISRADALARRPPGASTAAGGPAPGPGRGAAGGDAAAPGAPGALGSRQPRAADSDAVRPPATPYGFGKSGGSGRD